MSSSPSAVPPPCVPIAVRTLTSLQRGFRDSTAARTTAWMSRIPRLGIVSPTTLSSRGAGSGKILGISRNTAARTSGTRGLANTCSTTAKGGRFVTRGHRSVFIVVALCRGEPPEPGRRPILGEQDARAGADKRGPLARGRGPGGTSQPGRRPPRESKRSTPPDVEDIAAPQSLAEPLRVPGSLSMASSPASASAPRTRAASCGRRRSPTTSRRRRGRARGAVHLRPART